MLADAGRQSELVVAKVRVAVTVLLLLVPLSNVFTRPRVTEHRVGMAVTVAALLAALVVYWAVRRDRRPYWLGTFSTVFDVTLVSLALLTYVLTRQPLVATNSRVVFEAYFLAIAATCLRYDVRLCLLAGALSIGQYAGILLLATGMYDLDAMPRAIVEYGRFDWSSEVSRLILLGIASALSAVIVHRARDLRRLSSIDRMTGLFNRGHFDERFGAELSRARRLGRPLSVVMLDVDHFKEFNDQYGHAAGDAGLRSIADCVRLMTRRSDLVARYGGEEFVLLLPDTDPALALDKMEEIRHAVEELVIELPRGQGHVHLTVSAGIATFPVDGLEAELLIDEADARLFRAKRHGRNRILGRTDGVTRAYSRAS
ncbi:MAG TPA: GGDEF domain-containing protein [Gemmatimonadales bacterium]|nr:GGDEF domain-containing protein [Gemmatimonadales bacterium]